MAILDASEVERSLVERLGRPSMRDMTLDVVLELRQISESDLAYVRAKRGEDVKPWSDFYVRHQYIHPNPKVQTELNNDQYQWLLCGEPEIRSDILNGTEERVFETPTGKKELARVLTELSEYLIGLSRSDDLKNINIVFPHYVVGNDSGLQQPSVLFPVDLIPTADPRNASYKIAVKNARGINQELLKSLRKSPSAQTATGSLF